MVNDAEKFKADDEKQKERISAKNGLESYCFNMKTTIEDEKVKDKISADDMKAITDKCMRLSNGSTLTNLPRLRSSTRSRRKWRVFVTRSSRSCTRGPEECLVACLTWEACLELEGLHLEVVRAELDLPLRRLIKSVLSSSEIIYA